MDKQRIICRMENIGVMPSTIESKQTRPYNYKGISLLNITYKVLINCILSRLKGKVEEILGDYQGRFRSGKSMMRYSSSGRFSKTHWSFIKRYMFFLLTSVKCMIVFTEKAWLTLWKNLKFTTKTNKFNWDEYYMNIR